MEFGNITEFLEDKTILVTGATGFLAKIFVEKILRTQPNVKKLYLLLRAKDANSAMLRLHDEIIGKDLFKVVREKYGRTLNSFIAEKVTPIHGDITCESLGVAECDFRHQLWSEINVVVNFAATTNFSERYDVALDVNTFGALNTLNFAKECPQLMMLVHVSTAYVCGEEKGLILEKPLSMGEAKTGNSKIDIKEEKKLVDEKLNQLLSAHTSVTQIRAAMKDLGLQRARVYGWPNTYVFTKAMGEMMLMHFKENLPLLIIRPTVVTSTYKQPFPGWIEGAIRTIDSIIVGYGEGKLKCFVYSPNRAIDLIPADMVINGIIVAMAARITKKTSEIIYHFGSSSKNLVNFSMLREYLFHYFSVNPWINKYGEPVRVGKCTALTSMNNFYWYMNIRYILPIKLMQVANFLMLRRYQNLCSEFDRQIKSIMRLAELYEPYVFFDGVFDYSNSEKLSKAIREKNGEAADRFDFDPSKIDWADYIMAVHIPGLVKYLMK